MVRDCDTCRYGSLKKDFICGLCMSYANETGDYAYWLPDSHAYDYLKEMDKEEREKEILNYNKLRKGETEIMEKLDVKDMIEDALNNVLDNVKDKASDIIREQVVPAMKTAAENFLGELKEENTTTSSIWVKVRNTAVGLAVCLLVSVAEKVLLTTADNIDDDTKDETVEGAE